MELQNDWNPDPFEGTDHNHLCWLVGNQNPSVFLAELFLHHYLSPAFNPFKPVYGESLGITLMTATHIVTPYDHEEKY